MGSSLATVGLGLPALLGFRRQAPLCGLTSQAANTRVCFSICGGRGTDIFTQDFLYIGEKVAEFLEIALGAGLFYKFCFLKLRS